MAAKARKKAEPSKEKPSRRKMREDQPRPEDPREEPPGHHRAGEALGIVLLALSLLAFAALVSLQFGSGNLMGPFGRMLALSLYALLGLGGYLVVLAVSFIGARTLIGRGRTQRWSVWAGYLGATLSGAVLFHCLFPDYVVHGFTAGGKGGEILGEVLVALFSTAGTFLVTGVLMALCLMVATEASLVQTAVAIGCNVASAGRSLGQRTARLLRLVRRVFTWQVAESTQPDGTLALSHPLEDSEEEPAPKAGGEPAPKAGGEPAQTAQDGPEPATESLPEPASRRPVGEAKPKGPRIVESEFSRPADRPKKLGAVVSDELPGTYRLPELSMLESPLSKGEEIDRDSLQQLAARLTKALNVYGIQGEVTEIHPGPVVTLYEFRPAPGTKLARIESLDRDLAMTLKATRVRVARIPGKDTVGIEVPNKQRETVYLQEVLAANQFTDSKSLLTLALGKDISGRPTVCNLARAPHLLVAGSTGSGKSVGINVMLMSLLFRARPDQVRLIMIDPKMLEFSIYADIPHLLLPVVTDPKNANQALRWAVAEMERRYQLLSEAGVRSIDDYNRAVAEQREQAARSPQPACAADRAEGERDGDPAGQDPGAATQPSEAPEQLPFIVIVIDEFADLMMVAPKDVETSVARIAQKARAAGIHLVVATQRPSRDVITGLIKANFPSRLAFQVSSKVDSRVILDRNGAESLLGMGDMLFNGGGRSPERMQGAFVSTTEVNRVVTFLKEQARPSYNLDILQPDEDEDESLDDAADKDELYDRALFLVTTSRRASTSWIQRQLRIGYNRAARILEIMEHEGVVGAQQPGARNREVLAPPPPED